MKIVYITFFIFLATFMSCNSFTDNQSKRLIQKAENTHQTKGTDSVVPEGRAEYTHQPYDCVRGRSEPVVIKTVYPHSTFKLQSDSITAYETVLFDNGDKLVIKNWGCENYSLTFRFETRRFHAETTNLAFWFKKIVLLVNEVDKGIDAPMNIAKGIRELDNYIDNDITSNYKTIRLGEEIDFGFNEIRDFLTVDKITKLSDRRFALEITFVTGPL